MPVWFWGHFAVRYRPLRGKSESFRPNEESSLSWMRRFVPKKLQLLVCLRVKSRTSGVVLFVVGSCVKDAKACHSVDWLLKNVSHASIIAWESHGESTAMTCNDSFKTIELLGSKECLRENIHGHWANPIGGQTRFLCLPYRRVFRNWSTCLTGG